MDTLIQEQISNNAQTKIASNLQNRIMLDGDSLTIDQVWQVAHKQACVDITDKAVANIRKAREFVIKAGDSGKAIYGLTTGFAAFKDVLISKENIRQLSRNIILSHSVGVGEDYSEEVVRAAMLVRLNSLIKGYSGIQEVTARILVDMLNKNIFPYVPKKGSVGASGDLSPLCHISAVMLGEGEVIKDGHRIPGLQALRENGLTPIILEAKEGLALSNGTSVHTAQAVLNIVKAKRILQLADISASMSLEAFMGSMNAFAAEIQEIRPHKGQKDCAKNIRTICQDSNLVDKDLFYKLVQDSYSLRCIPQVHGAARDAFEYVNKVVEIEINSATDNPLIFVNQDKVLSGGNFHGEPIAIAMDVLAIAMSEIASIAERRIAKMVDSKNNHGLPAYLIDSSLGGLNSGLMMVQYTVAALVSENKVLSHPSSVDSIPTSANVEDHVSMAANAARHTEEIIDNVQNVLSIELLCAAQGIEFRDKSKMGSTTKSVHDLIRSISPVITNDRELYKDIAAIRKIVDENKVIDLVCQSTRELL